MLRTVLIEKTLQCLHYIGLGWPDRNRPAPKLNAHNNYRPKITILVPDARAAITQNQILLPHAARAANTQFLVRFSTSIAARRQKTNSGCDFATLAATTVKTIFGQIFP